MNNLLESNTSSLIDLVKDFLFELDKNKKKKPTKSAYLNGSISNYTKNLVLTFPMLCDNSLPPDTASMLSRANERNIVSMLQMLFASMNFNATSGAEVLSQIHKNIRVGYNLDDTIDALDNFIDNNLSESSKISSTDLKKAARYMIEQLKIPQKSFPVESLSERSLNNYLVYNMRGTTVVKEYQYSIDDDEVQRLLADAIGVGINTVSAEDEIRLRQLAQTYADARNAEDRARDAEIRAQAAFETNQQESIARELRAQAEELRKQQKELRDQAEEIRKQASFESEQQKNIAEELRAQDAELRAQAAERRAQNEENRKARRELLDFAKNRREEAEAIRREEQSKLQNQNLRNQNTEYKVNAISKQLLDTDIKKSNEMQPTLMVVRFNELDTDGKIYSEKPFVAGVKSRLIGVESSDIVDRIIVKNKTKVNFLNFIRATTGEIKFFRDFIFCIDQAKIDAKNAVKKGEAAQMWKVLETRSSKNYRNKARRAGNDASAITTLVLNQETVNILKKEHDFDIEKPKNARMILDSYNLLGIMIADESIEVVKYMYAGNDMFEQQAYSYLQKESNDNSYKKVINLIGKMNGR